MTRFSSLKEETNWLGKYSASLDSCTAKIHGENLHIIGTRLLETDPSESVETRVFYNAYVLNIAPILRKLMLISIKSDWGVASQLKMASSKASAMVDILQDANGNARPEEFFLKGIELGQMLVKLAKSKEW